VTAPRDTGADDPRPGPINWGRLGRELLAERLELAVGDVESAVAPVHGALREGRDPDLEDVEAVAAAARDLSELADQLELAALDAAGEPTTVDEIDGD
jgi:hypothetical protein